MNISFEDEIKAALANGPESDACRERLVEIGKLALADKKLPELALAFGKSPDIVWGEYLNIYPDVGQIGMQPLIHYMKFGLWEKRVLPCRSRAAQAPASDAPNTAAPIISIIMPNYNNEAFLEKSIGSLLKQTLANIEVVVVDDASTDNSLQVLERLAQNDRRIRIIRHETNKGTHMARATGVEAAAGEYVMFLDPDDYYVRNACETAARVMEEIGADIVHFNIRINNHGAPEEAIQRINEIFNGLRYGHYSIMDILDRQLIQRKMLHNVCNKVFKSAQIKTAFKLMEGGYFTAGEDMYEFLFILAAAKSYMKIDSILYVYNYGLGIASRQITDKDKIPLHSALFPSLADYYRKNNLSSYIDPIKDILFNWSLSVLNNLDGSQASYFINDMCAHYGKDYVLTSMVGANWKRPQAIRQMLKNFVSPIPVEKPVNIALVLPSNISSQGMEYLGSLVKSMKKDGISLYAFMGINLKLYPQAGEKPWILPLKPSSNNAAAASSRITEMLGEVKRNSITLIVEVNSGDKTELWDIFMARVCSIPRLLAIPPLCVPGQKGEAVRKQTLRLLENERVICAQPEDEVVLRIMGIDAEHGFNLYGRLTRNVILEKNFQRQIEEDAELLHNLIGRAGYCSQWQPSSDDIYKKIIHTLVPVV